MELFSWAFLATEAGCTIGTGVITQLFKKYIPVPTQIFSYIVAVIIFNAAAAFLGNWDWAVFGLTFFNAGLISLASNGGFEAIKKLFTNTENVDFEAGE